MQQSHLLYLLDFVKDKAFTRITFCDFLLLFLFL